MGAREPGRGAGSGPGEACPQPGATALLTGAIGYALVACARVAPGEMSLPTPCTEWDLRTLLGHLGDSMGDLEAAISTGRLDPDLNAPGAPGPRGDPVELLRDRAADLLCACYERRRTAGLILVGGLPLPAEIVACTGAVEIAVHGWDVSVARGRGGPIPPGLATRMLRLGPLLVAGREGLFAEPVEVSPQASPGDRLVAYLGRVPVTGPLLLVRNTGGQRFCPQGEGDRAPSARDVIVVGGVRPRGSTSGAAYYTPPSEDLTRPGRTWWPLVRSEGQDRLPTWPELSVVFHEAVPGHHLQVGAAKTAGDKLSRFAPRSASARSAWPAWPRRWRALTAPDLRLRTLSTAAAVTRDGSHLR